MSLDTNIILRLLLRDSPELFQEARQLLRTSRHGSLHLADAVLFEVVWILGGPYYQFNRDIVSDMLLDVAKIPQINCNRELIERAVPLYVKHSKLSFIDICLSVYAELNNAVPLLTFDKTLAKTLSNARLLTQNAPID